MLVVDLGPTDLINYVGNVSAIVLAGTAINPITHRLAHAQFRLARTTDRLGFGHPETSMKFILQPWRLVLNILASWVYREQEVIEYLCGENAVFEEKFCKKRILLADDQRWFLAVKGKLIGRKAIAARSAARCRLFLRR